MTKFYVQPDAVVILMPSESGGDMGVILSHTELDLMQTVAITARETGLSMTIEVDDIDEPSDSNVSQVDFRTVHSEAEPVTDEVGTPGLFDPETLDTASFDDEPTGSPA